MNYVFETEPFEADFESDDREYGGEGNAEYIAEGAGEISDEGDYEGRYPDETDGEVRQPVRAKTKRVPIASGPRLANDRRFANAWAQQVSQPADQSQSATGSSSDKVSLVFVNEGWTLNDIPEQLSGGNFVEVPRKQYRNLGAILLEKQANVLLVTGHHWVNHGGRLGEIGYGRPRESDNLYFDRVANTGPFLNVELLLMTGCYTLQKDRNIEFFNKIFPNAVIVGYEGSAKVGGGWTFLSEFRDLFLGGDVSLSVAEKSAVVAKGIGRQIRRRFATPPNDTYRRNMPRLKRALERHPAIFVPLSGHKGGTLYRFFWDSNSNSLKTSERAVRFAPRRLRGSK